MAKETNELKCGRLIDADVCIEKIKSIPVTYDAETVQRCIEIVSNAPTIDTPTVETVPVKRGEWIESDEYDVFCGRLYKCSNCNTFVISDFDNYCPYCGADMRGEG